MSNIYIGYHFTIEPIELGSEILIAELGEKAFESFIETETGISAYVQKDLWSETILEDIQILDARLTFFEYDYEQGDSVFYDSFSRGFAGSCLRLRRECFRWWQC